MEMDSGLTGPNRPTLSSRMTLCFLLLSCLIPFLSAHPLSGWHLAPPWEVVSQALVPSPLLHVPLLLKGQEEEFLLAQGRFGSEEGGDAISPPLPASTASRTLSFKYAKVGAADLQILLKEGDTFRLLDSVTETTGGKWHDRTTLLPAGQGEQQLYFRARGILDGLDAVAISSIQIKSSPTSVLSVTKNIPKGIRRKPISKQKPVVREFCEPIHCEFQKSSCQWQFQGFTPLDGKVVSKEGGFLISEPILQPANAHFQMEVFVSENAAATVHQLTGTEEQLLWTAGGMILPGWNTVRLPLRFSSFPSKVIIRATSLRGGYVAVRNTKLVDEFGTELACGKNVSPIKPAHDGTIRLTAVQKLGPQGPIHPQISRNHMAPTLKPPSRPPPKTTTARPPTVAPKLPQPTTFLKSVDVDKWKTLAKQFGLGEKAITPVNTDAKSSLLLGLPPSLQKAFSEKLSQFIDLPPTTTGRDTRPFSRQNMDWIVQHAFNSFMSGARP